MSYPRDLTPRGMKCEPEIHTPHFYQAPPGDSTAGSL